MTALLVLAALISQAGEPAPPLAADAGVPPPIEAEALPLEAPMNDFVPKGWKSVVEASGDLSGDGKPDKVMVLCPELAQQQMAWEEIYFSCGACVPREFNCALAVIMAQPTGGKRWAVETPVRLGSERTFEVTISKGTLLVRVLQGGHYSSSELLNRYRRKGERLLLIGTDRRSDSSHPTSSVQTSTNWLTAQRLERTCHGAAGDDEVCSRWKSSRVPRRTTYLGEGTLR